MINWLLSFIVVTFNSSWLSLSFWFRRQTHITIALVNNNTAFFTLKLEKSNSFSQKSILQELERVRMVHVTRPRSLNLEKPNALIYSASNSNLLTTIECSSPLRCFNMIDIFFVFHVIDKRIRVTLIKFLARLSSYRKAKEYNAMP